MENAAKNEIRRSHEMTRGLHLALWAVIKVKGGSNDSGVSRKKVCRSSSFIKFKLRS